MAEGWTYHSVREFLLDHLPECEADRVESVIMGLVEQLGAYCQVVPYASIDWGAVYVKRGGSRSFILARLYDRKSPLRLREATSRFDVTVGDRAAELVHIIEKARQQFLRKHRMRMERWAMELAGTLARYYEETPYVVESEYQSRILEDPVGTFWCLTIDNRSPVSQKDRRADYLIQ